MESDGIGQLSSQDGPPGAYSEVEERRSTAGDFHRDRPGGTDGDEGGIRAGIGSRVPSRFLWIPTEQVGS